MDTCALLDMWFSVTVSEIALDVLILLAVHVVGVEL